MLKNCFQHVKAATPLVHNITNYVTVNDVANIILACGGSPIMADEPKEAEAITSICGGLNINIGTLNSRTIEAMFLAGKKAAALSHPILLDPVGAGASSLRTDTAVSLIETIPFTVIRGNISEIKTLALGNTNTRGVDADAPDIVTKDNLKQTVSMVKTLAGRLHCVIAVTGAIDLVADTDRCYVIYNGVPEMSRITGTGCQLSGMMSAYITANPNQPLEAAATATIAMGIAGEIGLEHLQSFEGNSTYRNRIIDAICNLTEEELEKRANYEIF